MSRIAVFIDGAYLEFVLRQEFGAPRVDFELLARRLSDGRDLLRTYYYDCLPFRSEGAIIHLFHGRVPHDELRICCDERTRIDRALIDAVRLA